MNERNRGKQAQYGLCFLTAECYPIYAMNQQINRWFVFLLNGEYEEIRYSRTTNLLGIFVMFSD